MLAFFEQLPLWGVSVLTLCIAFASLWLGSGLARRRRRSGKHEDERAAGILAGATLSLFAFLLAFTFGLAANRYEARKATVLGEANAISTAFERADLMPEPDRGRLRQLLRDYVAARIEASDGDGSAGDETRSDALLRALLAQTAVVGRAAPDSPMAALVVSAVNAVSDARTTRLHQGDRDRVPRSIWVVLYLVTVMAIGSAGYQAGLLGGPRSPVAIALMVSFTAVMLLIADLDRPREGLLRLGTQALHDVSRMMVER
jgi:hypothetical protein